MNDTMIDQIAIQLQQVYDSLMIVTDQSDTLQQIRTYSLVVVILGEGILLMFDRKKKKNG